MCKLLFISLLVFLSSFVQAQVVSGNYVQYKGNLMGAEATIFLHSAGTYHTGFIVLTKDPRPFFIYMGSVEGDSLLLSGSRSVQTRVEMKVKIRDQQMLGSANMILMEKSIRKGKVTLKHDTTYTSAFNFTYGTMTGTLPAVLKNSSTNEVSASTIWPIANSNPNLAVALKKASMQFFQQKMEAAASTFLKTYLQQKITTWKTDTQKAYPKGAADMGQSLSAMLDQRMLVLMENKYCINFYQYTEIYSGGAHSNHKTNIIAIDKRTNKQLSIKDILTPEGIKALPALLEKSVRTQFGIASNAPLNKRLLVNKIHVSEIFFLADAGIGFWYDPYDIASFADGDVQLFIPFGSIASFIQPSFLK